MADEKRIVKLDPEKAKAKRSDILNGVLADIASIESVHISVNSNSKLGVIPSFSVLPLVTCGKNCEECSKYCYACKGYFNFNSNILNLAENTALIIRDPERVKAEINNFLNGQLVIYKYFRWNVAGDIFNSDYLDVIISVAKSNKNTSFLVFTKNFDLINSYIADGGKLPKNLKIIFSRWDNADIDNKNSFPVAITKINNNTMVPANAYHCKGDCSDCLECWSAKKKTNRYFDLH